MLRLRKNKQEPYLFYHLPGLSRVITTFSSPSSTAAAAAVAARPTHSFSLSLIFFFEGSPTKSVQRTTYRTIASARNSFPSVPDPKRKGITFKNELTSQLTARPLEKESDESLLFPEAPLSGTFNLSGPYAADRILARESPPPVKKDPYFSPRFLLVISCDPEKPYEAVTTAAFSLHNL